MTRVYVCLIFHKKPKDPESKHISYKNCVIGLSVSADKKLKINININQVAM